MKLGTETGSVMNHLYSVSEQKEPEVGMGATVLMWTDRYACTIISIEKNILEVQRDKPVRNDNNGECENQDYFYERNPKGAKYFFKKDRKGKYRETYKNSNGRWVFAGAVSLLIGHRREYFDYSF